MPNNVTDQQKKQAALYICNAMSIASKRKFENELKTNLGLQAYVDELRTTVETTREFSVLKPSDELLQGSRNLLKNRLQNMDEKQSLKSKIRDILDKITVRVKSIGRVKQPVWAIATYIIIGVIAGRLLLGPFGNKTMDLNGDGNLNIDELINSGLLSEVQIDNSALSPSTVKFVSSVDNRFNVSGDVNDQDVKKILYYLLLNDKDQENRLEAGKLISRIPPNEETQMVLISSLMNENDTQVKLQSILTLKNYTITTELENACKRILLDEHDSKIRLEALNILEQSNSSDLIQLLEVVTKMDDDSLVREKADNLLDELQKPVAIESTEVSQ